MMRIESALLFLEVEATNPEYNQPALRIKQASRTRRCGFDQDSMIRTLTLS